jgi:hypothetical protein
MARAQPSPTCSPPTRTPSPEPWIPYALTGAADVTIEIHDAGGAIARRLVVGRREAGRYARRGRAAYWDGRDDVGETVSAGVYFVTLRVGATPQTQRIVLAK